MNRRLRLFRWSKNDSEIRGTIPTLRVVFDVVYWPRAFPGVRGS